MKNLICIYILSLLFFYQKSHAQTIPPANNIMRNMHLTLEDKVNKSDMVIEGEGIGGTHFRVKGMIYTAATVRISKIFKGDVSDTIIEIVYEGGCMVKDTLKDGIIREQCITMSDGGFGVSKGSDGVFLLRINNTARLDTKLKSYLMYDFIKYHHGAEMVAHHIATSRGVTYDDLERDLYQRIEAVTKVPRKVIGLNSFEIEAAKKPKK